MSRINSPLEEQALELFSSGYNCSQAVTGALCQEAGLNMDLALKIANGFGGGVRCGELCGAVAGAVLVLSAKHGFYAKGDMEQKEFCNKKIEKLAEKFKEQNGGISCRELLGADIRCPSDHRNTQVLMLKTKCKKFVASAVKIFESMEFGEKQQVIPMEKPD